MRRLTFTDRHGSFTMERPENTSYLYFPLASEAGLKSSVTPNLGGDAKLGQDSFLMEPASADTLQNNRSGRNFWFRTDDARVYSAAGASAEQEAVRFTSLQDNSTLEAGFMWHKIERSSRAIGLWSSVTSFIPPDANVEILYVTVKNISEEAKELTAFAAIPIYGRSADNLRDHRHVTSLLHRIRTVENGVYVCPSMSFDERGHRQNHRIYYAAGCTAEGKPPVSFYPTAEEFLGEGGTYTHPRAVYEDREGVPSHTEEAGKEAAGAFRFEKITLTAGGSAGYLVFLGAEDEEEQIQKILSRYNTEEKVKKALEDTREYWKSKVNVSFSTGDGDFDSLMKWICFQPFLRRLFGCSFLPHHDYGRGGRGWRDLWQDCLSLLLMDPQNVREMIVKSCGGIRIDGTNATIIGDDDGSFIADRNGITRVWMDHALWPLMTTKLYIDQTGDTSILTRKAPYFKDGQALRGSETDPLWRDDGQNFQCTESDQVYLGSILEHLLIQQLTAFHDVGGHNIYRLRGGDWNDALDMAPDQGESVAFTCAYAGTLRDLTSLLRQLSAANPQQEIEIIEELKLLLDFDPALYDDSSARQKVLREYMERCRHAVSGRRIRVSLSSLISNLLQRTVWLTDHIREQEWIAGNDGEGWFNSYYDNHGKAVEGFFHDHVRMMLTGQVFSIMGQIATEEQIESIIKSADHYLYDPNLGGYRLNTDFQELKFDLGRMFGFAYGEKENGSVFSHMAVMYANALYRRGFAKKGYQALRALADTALDFDTSRIYPGIPEYFRGDGRGMYHYLTGAASWYMLTMITEVFGVRGAAGDLILQPKLLAEQFDCEGKASIRLTFAGKKLKVTYINHSGTDYGSYSMSAAACGGIPLSVCDHSYAIIPRTLLLSLPGEEQAVTAELSL